MDSLRKKRRNQTIAVIAACALLGGLVALSVLRPSPEEKEADSFQQLLLDGRAREMNDDERKALREQWQRFSPETRRAVFTEVARARLEEMRRQTESLTAEQRTARIQQALNEMRGRREQLTPEQKARVKERLTSTEGQEMVRHVMSFYQTELTARERADLDPLVHEWLRRMERMVR